MPSFNPNDYLLPVELVTGLVNPDAAILALSCRGAVVQRRKHGGGKTYASLPEAVRWNQVEAREAPQDESAFRQSLLKDLRAVDSHDTRFSYSGETLTLWKRAFYGV